MEVLDGQPKNQKNSITSEACCNGASPRNNFVRNFAQLVRLLVHPPSHWVVSLTDLATSVQAGLVLVLEQTGLVQAVLMQACLRAARNVVRRALHAAFDVAPCRTSVPERQWLEPRSPTQPRILERKRSFDARSFPIRFFRSCPTLLDFDQRWRVFAIDIDPNQRPTKGTKVLCSSEPPGL